jgi:hypothetical protein
MILGNKSPVKLNSFNSAACFSASGIRQINDAGMHNTSLLGKGIISGQLQITAPFFTFILSFSSTLKCLASSPLAVEDF